MTDIKFNTVNVRKFEELDSSFIDSIAYDSGSLYVTLGSDTYRYDDVPEEEFDLFSDASSAGHYYQGFRAAYGPADGHVVDMQFHLMPSFEDAEDVSKHNVVNLSVLNGGGEAKEDFNPEEFMSALDEQLAGIESGANKKIALACATNLFQGRGNSTGPDFVLQVSEQFEKYLNG